MIDRTVQTTEGGHTWIALFLAAALVVGGVLVLVSLNLLFELATGLIAVAIVYGLVRLGLRLLAAFWPASILALAAVAAAATGGVAATDTASPAFSTTHAASSAYDSIGVHVNIWRDRIAADLRHDGGANTTPASNTPPFNPPAYNPPPRISNPPIYNPPVFNPPLPRIAPMPIVPTRPVSPAFSTWPYTAPIYKPSAFPFNLEDFLPAKPLTLPYKLPVYNPPIYKPSAFPFELEDFLPAKPLTSPYKPPVYNPPVPRIAPMPIVPTRPISPAFNIRPYTAPSFSTRPFTVPSFNTRP